MQETNIGELKQMTMHTQTGMRMLFLTAKLNLSSKDAPGQWLKNFDSLHV